MKPNRPPTAAISLADRVPGLLLYHETNAHAPNSSSAHAPNEMGEKLLNIRCGRLFDWKSMCQKRSERPRSNVSNAPDSTAPQKPTEEPVRITGRSSGRPNHSSSAARK